MKNVLAKLNQIIIALENVGRQKEASVVHEVFTKVAEDWDLTQLKKEHDAGFGNEAVSDLDYLNLNDLESSSINNPAPFGSEDITDDSLNDMASNAYACITSLGRYLHPEYKHDLEMAYLAIWRRSKAGSKYLLDDPQAKEDYCKALDRWIRTADIIIHNDQSSISPQVLGYLSKITDFAKALREHIGG